MERIWVPIVGTVAVVAFALIELTGSGADLHAAQTLGTALAALLFTIFGTVGIALTRIRPRLALLGVATVMLSMLAFGAFVAALWSQSRGVGYGFSGAQETVGVVTVMLAIAATGASALLVSAQPEEESAIRVVRFSGIGALVAFFGLGILALVDSHVDIGLKVYAYLATVYVVAVALLIVVRLLPDTPSTR